MKKSSVVYYLGIVFFTIFISVGSVFAKKEALISNSEEIRNKKHLVIITDCTDVAANEIRASILNELNEVDNIIIEPVVNVKEFKTLHCNFIVRLMADIYPEGTTFVIVFNSDQKRPESLIGKTKHKNLTFIGRNTGAFDWLTRDFGCECLYDASELFTQLNSEFLSFSGKLVTAPTAAKIARGEKIERFGKPISVNRIRRMSVPKHTIAHIDNFGMIKFTGSMEDPIPGDRYEITIGNNTFEAVYNRRMQSEEIGVWVLFPGSSFGLYELGKVRCYGAQSIGAEIGDKIRIRKIKK